MGAEEENQSPKLKDVMIVCPVCGTQKMVPVPVEKIVKKNTGTTSVFIPIGLMCQHEFYVYIDKNLDVRDYLVLEFSLMDDSKKIEAKKRMILNDADNINFSKDKFLEFISEQNLLDLIYASFLGSQIILIEEDLDSMQWKMIFVMLVKLFPEMFDKIHLFSREKFLDFEKNNSDEVKNITVYNLIYKLMVYKPFSDTEAESLRHVLETYGEGDSKVQIILAKNEIDYLKKIAKEERSLILKEKPEKIVKKLKKKYPRQQNYFTISTVLAMRHRIRFREALGIKD